jgi:hypothetical protein
MKRQFVNAARDYRLFAAALMGLLCGVPVYSQGVYYVRAGAGGAANGSDWNNAYPSLPGTLQRGATYYVAGGAYPSYTFNTPALGAQVITLKKASLKDHGTETGWNPSYGTNQAVFSAHIFVQTSYFVLDGQYRNEKNWFDGDAYGFSKCLPPTDEYHDPILAYSSHRGGASDG